MMEECPVCRGHRRCLVRPASCAQGLHQVLDPAIGEALDSGGDADAASCWRVRRLEPERVELTNVETGLEDGESGVDRSEALRVHRRLRLGAQGDPHVRLGASPVNWMVGELDQLEQAKRLGGGMRACGGSGSGRRDSVAVPDLPELPPVLILTGAPGSGKTTGRTGVWRRNGRARIHLGDRRLLRLRRVEASSPAVEAGVEREQNAVVMGVVGDAAARYAEAGYFTILDGIVIPGIFLEPLRDSLHARRPHGRLVVLAGLAGRFGRWSEPPRRRPDPADPGNPVVESSVGRLRRLGALQRGWRRWTADVARPAAARRSTPSRSDCP